jgi:alpha/beta superfamily hydrolase
VGTEAKSALAGLRTRKELAKLPVILMGASLGTRAASRLFVADPQIAALVLMVPGSTEACKISKQEKRPIFLIQAEKDDVVGDGQPIHRCLPLSIKYLLLKGTAHRFPPSQVATQIIDWLDSMLSHKS